MNKIQTKQLFNSALEQIYELSLKTKTLRASLTIGMGTDDTNSFFAVIAVSQPTGDNHAFFFFSSDEYEDAKTNLQRILDTISTDRFDKVTEAYQKFINDW